MFLTSVFNSNIYLLVTRHQVLKMQFYTRITVFLFLLSWRGRAAAELRPRAACPTAASQGWQCSSDCTKLGYCDGHSWTPSYSCPDGQKCVDGACGNYASCPTEVVDYNVWCSDPSLKMPDLDDPECKTYFSCTARTTSEIGFGRAETCPIGTTFDRCSGKCTIGVGCNLFYTDEPCGPVAQQRRILTSNLKLAYTCTARYTIWTTCPNGYYMDYGDGPDCYEGLAYGCTNGNGEGNGSTGSDENDSSSDNDDNDDGSCTTVGVQAVPGNTCVYKLCFADGSFQEYGCASGHYFDKLTKQCEKGVCTKNEILYYEN